MGVAPASTKRQLRLEKADSSGTSPRLSSWQHPKDWQRHAGAKPREEETNRPQYRTRVAIVAVVDQKGECSMIGRDLFSMQGLPVPTGP